jgi:hypothetical protein
VHAVPSTFTGLEQAPVVMSHVPAVWHSSKGVQETGVPPLHMPPMHTLFVHALPPSHAVPSAMVAKEHVPSPLQIPSWWQGAGTVHA